MKRKPATLSPPVSQFVERIGLLLEAERFPRIAGRILGLLLASAEPLSLDDIAALLGVTKASISTNARLLFDKGVLERVSLTGDRRDHYRAASDMPLRTLQARIARMRQVHDALASGRDAIAPTDPVIRDRFDDMISSYDYMLDVTMRALDELPARVEKARAQRRRAR